MALSRRLSVHEVPRATPKEFLDNFYGTGSMGGTVTFFMFSASSRFELFLGFLIHFLAPLLLVLFSGQRHLVGFLSQRPGIEILRLKALSISTLREDHHGIFARIFGDLISGVIFAASLLFFQQ